MGRLLIVHCKEEDHPIWSEMTCLVVACCCRELSLVQDGWAFDGFVCLEAPDVLKGRLQF